MGSKAILAPWLVQVQPGQCKILSHKAWGEASYFPIHFYWTLNMRANLIVSLTGSKINQAISCCTHLWRVSLTRLSEVGGPTLKVSDSFQWQPATRRPKRKVLLFVLLPSHLAGECIYSVVPDAVFSDIRTQISCGLKTSSSPRILTLRPGWDIGASSFKDEAASSSESQCADICC